MAASGGDPGSRRGADPGLELVPRDCRRRWPGSLSPASCSTSSAWTGSARTRSLSCPWPSSADSRTAGSFIARLSSRWCLPSSATFVYVGHAAGIARSPRRRRRRVAGARPRDALAVALERVAGAPGLRSPRVAAAHGAGTDLMARRKRIPYDPPHLRAGRKRGLLGAGAEETRLTRRIAAQPRRRGRRVFRCSPPASATCNWLKASSTGLRRSPISSRIGVPQPAPRRHLRPQEPRAGGQPRDLGDQRPPQ